MFIDTVIRDYKKYFKDLNITVDFKIVTKIPDLINNRVDDIHQFYNKENITGKYVDWLKKQQFKHIIKAWNTKFYIIQEFFKSKYNSMMYLDCDLILKNPKKAILFDSTDLCFIKRTHTQQTNKEHIQITKKYISDININTYIQAGCFSINKQNSFNLKNILNLDKIYTLWKKNNLFLREEVTLTYLFYKNNLINKVRKNIRYKHIGNWETKLNFLNESKT